MYLIKLLNYLTCFSFPEIRAKKRKVEESKLMFASPTQVEILSYSMPSVASKHGYMAQKYSNADFLLSWAWETKYHAINVYFQLTTNNVLLEMRD